MHPEVPETGSVYKIPLCAKKEGQRGKNKGWEMFIDMDSNGSSALVLIFKNNVQFFI